MGGGAENNFGGAFAPTPLPPPLAPQLFTEYLDTLQEVRTVVSYISLNNRGIFNHG